MTKREYHYIKSQFVTADIAFKLQELGYNELCFTNVRKDGSVNNPFDIDSPETFLHEIGEQGFTRNTTLKRNDTDWATLPTWHQAIQWLWRRFKIRVEVLVCEEGFYSEISCDEYPQNVVELGDAPYRSEYKTYVYAVRDAINDVYKLKLNEIKYENY